MFSTCECLSPISYSMTFLVNNNDNIDESNNGNNDFIRNIYRLGKFF